MRQYRIIYMIELTDADGLSYQTSEIAVHTSRKHSNEAFKALDWNGQKPKRIKKREVQKYIDDPDLYIREVWRHHF